MCEAKLPRVDCAICKRPVEKIEASRDDATMEFRLRVWCHGETRVMVVSDFDLQDDEGALTRALESGVGVAFGEGITKDTDLARIPQRVDVNA